MQRFHDLAMAHLQQQLQHARRPGGQLQMANIRLHRTDAAGHRNARPVLGLGFFRQIGEGRRQRLCLDGVAQLRTGAVRLDVRDRARIEPGLAVGGAQQLGLCLRVRRGQRTGTAAVILRRGAHHGEDAVAIALRIGQPLQEHQPQPLAPGITVGRVGEGL